MPQLLVLTLDLVALVAALAAAWFWYLASGRRLRRISRDETLDAADINRIVIAINRNQILNSRAALAAAVAALLAAVRFGLDWLGR
jgi:fumarate reductase subunit C